MLQDLSAPQLFTHHTDLLVPVGVTFAFSLAPHKSSEVVQMGKEVGRGLQAAGGLLFPALGGKRELAVQAESLCNHFSRRCQGTGIPLLRQSHSSLLQAGRYPAGAQRVGGRRAESVLRRPHQSQEPKDMPIQ